MGESGRGVRRAHLARMIEDKMDLIEKFRLDLEQKKRLVGNSVDEQIVVAELEYCLVKEEMALLTLQEQHWQSAAFWDNPHTPDIQKEVCEVLHSYILSVKEKGAIPALHASEHLAMENSILISSQSDKPSLPKVEWAHHSTDLQIGDRLLEVNGHLVIGKDSSEVGRILSASRPLCRIVFLRPLSLQQLAKSNGCRETSNLRHELTSVVGRLNHKIIENANLRERNSKFQKENEELVLQNRKLKLQVLSLQSVLLYLFQVMDKKGYQCGLDSIHSSTILSQCSNMFDALHDQGTPMLCPDTLRGILAGHKKSIPWMELGPVEVHSPANSDEAISQTNSDL